jgi:hypothetical protein
MCGLKNCHFSFFVQVKDGRKHFEGRGFACPVRPIKAKIEPVSTLKLTLFIAVKSSNSGEILTKLEIIIYSNNLYWILK